MQNKFNKFSAFAFLGLMFLVLFNSIFIPDYGEFVSGIEIIKTLSENNMVERFIKLDEEMSLP